MRPWRSATGRIRSRRSRPASTHPAGRKPRWSRGANACPGSDVVPEQAAVVDHARDELHAVLARRGQDELARPRLERVEDHHRPLDQLAEALEAVDEVEREAVRRPRRDADRAGQALVADGPHRLPDHRARVAGAVGVVQEQEIERAGADALERPLRRHPDVVGVAVRAAQARVGEAREALRPLALARVEVVADRADDAVAVAVEAGERAAEERVGLAGAVGVGGDDRVDPLVRAQERGEALVVERLAEVHEPPAAPGAEGGVTERDHRRRV